MAILKFFGLSLLSLAIGCATSSKKSPETTVPANQSRTAEGLGLEDMLHEKVSDAADALAWLKNCAQKCRAADRDIAKSMAEGYQLLFDVSQQVKSPADVSEQQREAIALAQDKIRAGFTTILQTRTDRDLLELSYRELNGGQLAFERDPEAQDIVHATVERLKKDPKTLATAWFLQGLSIPATEENLQPSIQAYQSCLKLDSQDPGCRLNYNELVQYYERQRCTDGNFASPMKLRIGRTSKDGVYQSSVKADGRDFYLHMDPVLTDLDFLEGTLELSSGLGRYEIILNLKTFSLTRWQRALAAAMDVEPATAKPEIFSISLKDQLIDVSILTESVNEGLFHLPFRDAEAATKLFKQICSNPVAEKLPEFLRLQ